MTTTQFAVDPTGRTIFLMDSAPTILDDLPPKTYALRITPKGELYLELIEEFNTPTQLFGDVREQSARIVNTFTERPGVTGILLTGEKGSGKTMLGKLVAQTLRDEQQMPIIIVNIPISGDDFGIFLQRINKPVTLFFDEFEKVYHREGDQNGLLTILDGVYPMKIMAILTSNDQSKLITPLINRPGRVFYKIDYHGLDYNFVLEYAQNKLNNKSHIDALARLAILVTINFDQLQALIEEMNRYDESVEDAVQMLNITTERDSFFSMDVLEFHVGDNPHIGVAELKSKYYRDELTPTDEDPVIIHYKVPNTQGLTQLEWMRSVDDDARYDASDTWRYELFGSSVKKEDVLPFLPGRATFKGDTRLDVRRDGRITMTNSEGDFVVLRKSPPFNRKAF